MKNETFLRVIVLIFMSLLFVGVFISALLLLYAYSDATSLLHKSFGLFFTLFLVVHISLRKEKLIKMLKEFYTLLMQKEQNTQKECNKLIKTLKQRPLEEICSLLNIDMQHTLSLLNEKNIVVKSVQDSLENISKENQYDALKISAMLMETQLRIHQKNKI